MNLLTELNAQAETLYKELKEARAKSVIMQGAKAAYHKGRAEELARWLESVEGMISKIIERKEAERAER